jgi:hypothetical protein
LNGSATVFLPFPPEEFKKASVGQDWDARFDQVLTKDRVELRIIHRESVDEAQQSAAFEECNRAMLSAARKQADLLDDGSPLLLTVWEGKPGDGVGGTADAIAEWNRDGLETENVALTAL